MTEPPYPLKEIFHSRERFRKKGMIPVKTADLLILVRNLCFSITIHIKKERVRSAR